MQATVAAYDFIFICIFYRSDNQRRKNTLRLYAFNQRVHLRIIPDLKRVSGKGRNFSTGIATGFFIVFFILSPSFSVFRTGFFLQLALLF